MELNDDPAAEVAEATIPALLEKAHISRAKLCRQAGIDPQTLRRAIEGMPIREGNANQIKGALAVLLADSADVSSLHMIEISVYHGYQKARRS